ncbi:glycosyltransferase [Zwartia sp.]|uniref:glycosyltransferase n=1 Tax=Zwartia sp. TaxID=2978004 RepID=UPI00271BEA40|nr:glycosyltransferase [Zwartia sp.]MDO9023588.1 glycosyltransferase [Zwartia sp.]
MKCPEQEEKDRMRVLHVFKTFLPDTFGGIEQVIHSLASHTQPFGVENRVLTLTQHQPRTEVDPSGYTIVRHKCDLYVASTGFSWQFFVNFKKEIEWADVVHMHFPWPFADLCYELARVRKPTVVSYHADIVKQVFLNKLYQPLLNRYFSHVDVICAASPGLLGTSPVLKRFKDKTRLVTYGIQQADRLAGDDPDVVQWRNRFGNRFFLFLGALRYYKGLHILIEALKGRDYPVVIAGKGSEGDALKAQALAAGLNNLHFLPEVSPEQKPSLMRAAYGFVFPSHLSSEAFGIVLVEAAQQGTPMISCELGTGTTYVNQHERTGLVVQPSDPEAFGVAMDTFWQHPEKVCVWGAQALQHFDKHFKAEVMAQEYLAVYQSVL